MDSRSTEALHSGLAARLSEMHGKYSDFNLQIILMQIRSSVRQYFINVKTATTAYDQSLENFP